MGKKQDKKESLDWVIQDEVGRLEQTGTDQWSVDAAADRIIAQLNIKKGKK